MKKKKVVVNDKMQSNYAYLLEAFLEYSGNYGHLGTQLGCGTCALKGYFRALEKALLRFSPKVYSRSVPSVC